MSEELARLRADLATVKAACKIYESGYKGCDVYAMIAVMSDKIARLEAEAADPWREAKQFASAYREPSESSNLQKLIAHYDHLTAENERLTARVAELEAVAECRPLAEWIEKECKEGFAANSAAFFNPDDPILDPFRAMRSVADHLEFQEITGARDAMMRISLLAGDAKPYRLKGAENGS